MKLIKDIRQYLLNKEVIQVNTKIVHKYKQKTQKQVFNELRKEVTVFRDSHIGWRVKGYSKPTFHQDGSVLYKIIYRKTKRARFLHWLIS